MSELTLPGDIPGPLRRGSPVIYQPRPRYQTSCLWRPGAEVVVLTTWRRGEAMWVDVADAGGTESHPVICVALDLTDATGRAHAGLWLAHTLCPEIPEVVWAGLGVSTWTSWDVPRFNLTTVTREGRERRSVAQLGADDLNPDDPRRLPDGSRWVDAEALRLVCLHVAGRAP